MKYGSLVLLVLLAPLAVAARADILILKSGGRVEGVVRELPGSFVVKTIHGSARIGKDRVVRRIEVPYITEIYAEKLEKLDATDPQARFLLALWCEGFGLKDEARMHIEETLLLDPDHERARARLGYVRFSGIWMTPAEAKSAAMAAAGFIPFEGKWFTREGLRAYLEAKGEMARIEEETARLRAEREKAELAAKLEAERLEKEKAERKALEQALARAEEDRRARERLENEIRDLRDLLRDLAYRGSLGLGAYGYAGSTYLAPTYTTRYASRAWGLSYGPSIAFRWSRGNLEVRGRVR